MTCEHPTLIKLDDLETQKCYPKQHGVWIASDNAINHSTQLRIPSLLSYSRMNLLSEAALNIPWYPTFVSTCERGQGAPKSIFRGVQVTC